MKISSIGHMFSRWYLGGVCILYIILVSHVPLMLDGIENLLYTAISSVVFMNVQRLEMIKLCRSCYCDSDYLWIVSAGIAF